jgi:hypothetical protein
MSGLGHLAAGLAAKPLVPEVPLWVLLAAGETNDVLYFAFTAAGLEKPAEMTMSLQHGVTYLTQAQDPYSHGLLMSMVWSLAALALARLVFKKWRPAAAIVLAVASHWLLDFLMHSNLPLAFNGSPGVGLGLENSGPGFIFMTVLDLTLLSVSLWFYLSKRRHAPIGARAQNQQ